MDDPRTRLHQSLAQSRKALAAIQALHASLLELESALFDLQYLAGTPNGGAAVQAAHDALTAAAQRRVIQ